MRDYVIIWRRESSLRQVSIQAETHGEAYDKFRSSSPGGGVPNVAVFNRINDRVMEVHNTSHRCLVTVVAVS